MASHDLEDIIAIVDGRDELSHEVDSAPPELRQYLATKFSAFLANTAFADALPGHLAGDEARQPLVEERLRRIATPRPPQGTDAPGSHPLRGSLL